MVAPYFSKDRNTWTLSSSETSDATTLGESLCQYAGRRCRRPRALKLNGELHKLCHLHRLRANTNQRRSQLRSKLQRLKPSDVFDSDSLQSSVQPHNAETPATEQTSLFLGAVATGASNILTTVSASVECALSSLVWPPSWLLPSLQVTSTEACPVEPPIDSGWLFVDAGGATSDMSIECALQNIRFQVETPSPESSSQITASEQSSFEGSTAGVGLSDQANEPIRFDASTSGEATLQSRLSASAEKIFLDLLESPSPPGPATPINSGDIVDMDEAGDANGGLGRSNAQLEAENVAIPIPEPMAFSSELPSLTSHANVHRPLDLDEVGDFHGSWRNPDEEPLSF
jgi:hypothetical protein